MAAIARRTLCAGAATLGLLAGLVSAGSAGALREPAAVTLSGSPRQRGLAHGRALRSEIRAGVARWKGALATAHATDADHFIARFLERTDYLPAIRRWTPGLLEEVRGIADGAGLDFDSVLAFQLLDELRANGGAAEGDHSSAIGIFAGDGQPGYVAQNVDLEGFRDGFQTVLRIREKSGRESLVFTQAGLVALNGLNDRGVAVVVAGLAERPGARAGLPVAFAVRGILQRESLSDAIAFIEQIPHASGQSYILGGRERVVELEASPEGVVERAAAGDGRVIFHTSHPLAHSQESPARRRVLLAGDGAPAPDRSEVGLATLATRLSRYDGTPPLALIEETLRSQDSPEHPICRPHRGDDSVFSFGSTIMQLSEAPELRIAPGPPDRHDYRVFRFD